jgi:ABC-type dipeptide/oligopeptide/nickel transport system permease subunit
MVGHMEPEPPPKWKSDCLRFALAPFKAYAIGVPLVLAIWWSSFQEPNPHGWDDRAADILTYVLAGIFSTLEFGYLVCLAGLVMGIVVGCRIGDVKGVRSALWYAGLVLLCLLLLFPAAHPPHHK